MYIRDEILIVERCVVFVTKSFGFSARDKGESLRLDVAVLFAFRSDHAVFSLLVLV